MKTSIFAALFGLMLLGLCACAGAPNKSVKDQGFYGSVGVGRSF